MRLTIWYAGKQLAHCPACGRWVRPDKPIIGSLHMCQSDCDVIGRHIALQHTRRGWLPWRRYTETWCAACGATVVVQ